MPGLNAYEMLS